MSAVFLSKASLRALVLSTVQGLAIPAVAASAGSFQNPKRSKLIAAAETAIGGPGLARARHLRDFVEAAEAVRTIQYTPAATGSYEDPALNLRRRTAALLPNPEHLLKPQTARTVLDLLNHVSFS